jgi:protein-tyrosine phosphatase
VDPAVDMTVADGRALGLAGAPNARDLGGLVGADGRPVRPGALVRSGALARLTEDDLPVLAELSLTCLVDLRHGTEIAQSPTRQLPEPVPRVLNAPVYDDRHPVFSYVTALLNGDDLSRYADLAAQGAPGAMAAIYRWFVTGDDARASFGAACRALADPANLPALFHCSVGKDRTGWLTAILLTALGVDPEAIRVDYLQTNEATAEAQQRLLELLAERRPGADPEAIQPLLQARPAYLDAAYAEVERQFGSFQAYLRAGLGLDDGTLAALRTNLLAP